MSVMVGVQGDANLFKIVPALHAAGSFAGKLNRGKQESHQDANDGNDYQQLDERKGPFLGRTSAHTKTFEHDNPMDEAEDQLRLNDSLKIICQLREPLRAKLHYYFLTNRGAKSNGFPQRFLPDLASFLACASATTLILPVRTNLDAEFGRDFSKIREFSGKMLECRARRN